MMLTPNPKIYSDSGIKISHIPRRYKTAILHKMWAAVQKLHSYLVSEFALNIFWGQPRNFFLITVV